MRGLVVLRCGRSSLHWDWLEGPRRNWDLILCPYQDIDARDAEANTVHLWIEDADGRVVSTLRLLDDGESGHRIGRVATLLEARGRGYSGALLRSAIEMAGPPIVMSAQAYLTDWYGQFGFEVCGEHWIEDGIDHAPMRLDVRR